LPSAPPHKPCRPCPTQPPDNRSKCRARSMRLVFIERRMCR
jgi:hypothetical protein